MRYGIVIGIIIGLIGCGEVEPAGDGGTGTAGSGGSMMAGTTGAGGTGGTGGTGGAFVECVPDACNTCVNGMKAPVIDGTQCGPGWCDTQVASPFQHAGVSHRSVCRSGVCSVDVLDCSTKAPGCTCEKPLGYVGCFPDNGDVACICVTTSNGYCEQPYPQ